MGIADLGQGSFGIGLPIYIQIFLVIYFGKITRNSLRLILRNRFIICGLTLQNDKLGTLVFCFVLGGFLFVWYFLK